MAKQVFDCCGGHGKHVGGCDGAPQKNRGKGDSPKKPLDIPTGFIQWYPDKPQAERAQSQYAKRIFNNRELRGKYVVSVRPQNGGHALYVERA